MVESRSATQKVGCQRDGFQRKAGGFSPPAFLLLGGYQLLNETGIGQRLLGSRLQVFRA